MKRILISCLFLLSVLTAGCSTQPSRFYMLEPRSPSATAVSVPDLILGVGPVRLAGYLERPQIVSRIRSSRLDVEEFDRWGGTLESNVTWVLAENLSRRLGTQSVVTFPWERVVVPDYQVAVDIRQFNPLESGLIELVAQWRITTDDGRKLLAIQTSSITEPVQGMGLDAQISAQSRALARLSDDIASAVRTFLASG